MGLGWVLSIEWLGSTSQYRSTAASLVGGYSCKVFFNLSKYLEIVKLKLIIMYGISIHVWDILPSRGKFKASLLELDRFYLTGRVELSTGMQINVGGI